MHTYLCYFRLELSHPFCDDFYRLHHTAHRVEKNAFWCTSGSSVMCPSTSLICSQLLPAIYDRKVTATWLYGQAGKKKDRWQSFSFAETRIRNCLPTELKITWSIISL